MSWTLYRYILKDLIRLLVVATVVLVTLISTAAAIQPLSEGELGPGLVIKFVIYMMPSMLQFALPFAAAFASTVAFVRLAADNEILACRASGLSYRTILMPVFLLGFVLMMGQIGLSNYIAPSFYKKATLLIQDDLTSLIVSQLKKNETAKINDMVLYADRADEIEPGVIEGSEVQPSRRILLEGVAVGRIGADEKMQREATAEFADVVLYRVHGQSWVTMTLEETMYYDELRGDLFYAKKQTLQPILLPSPLSDRAQFMSWPELQQLSREPDRFDQARSDKRVLITAIAAEHVLHLIEGTMNLRRPAASEGEVYVGEVKLLTLGGDEYVIRAPYARRSPDLNLGQVILQGLPGHPIEVEARMGNLPTRRIYATEGVMSVETTADSIEPRIVVELGAVMMRDLRAEDRTTQRERLELPLMRYPKSVVGASDSWDVRQVLIEAEQDEFRHVPAIAIAASNLNGMINRLYRRVISQINERVASAISTLLILLFGALLAIKMRGSMTLVVYLWSFLLAIVTVIVTRSGENVILTSKYPWPGLMVTWAGTTILMIVLAITYVRLRRH